MSREMRGAAEGLAAPMRAVLPLDEVIGQAGAVGALRLAVESGRVHHAWVFAGPGGVGKFTTAVGFAALALDPTLGPDLSGRLVVEAESQTQRLVRAWTHPDLHVVTKELAGVSREERVRGQKQTTIAKEVLREFLIEPALRTAVLSGGKGASKVFIVDEAELLDAGGQNTLLKVLEEPPTGTVFILVTQQEERLLATIRSRCRRVGFFPLTAGAMGEWMERSGVAREKRSWVMEHAGGSPGAAKEMVEHGLERWSAELGPMLAGAARGEFSPGLGGAMARLVEERAAEAVKANPEASKDAANKAWGRRMLAFVAEDLRRRLVERVGGGGGGEEDGEVRRLLRGIDAVQAAEEHVMSNVQAGFAFENLAAQVGKHGAA